MSVAAPSSAPRLASRPTLAGPSRPVAARTVAARPAPRPAAAAAGSSASVKSTSSSAARTAAPARTPAPVVQCAPATGGKDTSSSAGKVFAKPSKEWVLPERAKPGRKVSVEEPDSKRQSQNRLSQRAHRARRTDYIATLEERIRQFENDEIHSNVRLQEVARALKADNERLKDEVTTLQTSLSASASKRGSPVPKGWEEERGILLNEVRSLRDEVAILRARLGASPGSGAMLRVNGAGVIDMRSLTGTPIGQGQSQGRTPTAMINGSDPDARPDLTCPICPNPDPDCPCQRNHLSTLPSYSVHAHPHSHQLGLSHSHHAHLPDPSIPLGSAVLSDHLESTHSCGFCASNDECLCRAVQVDEEEDIKPDISMLTPPTTGIPLDESCGLCADGGFCACAVARGSPSASTTTNSTSEGKAPWAATGSMSGAASGVYAPVGVVNMSSATAAVPLRRLKNATSNAGGPKKSLWALDSGIATASTPIAPLSKAEAQCTGDPRNCDACRNDTFGKEFCENFFTEDDPVPIPGPSATSSTRPPPTRSSTFTAGLPAAPSNVFWKTHEDDSADDMDDPMESDIQAPLIMSCCGNAGLCNHPQGGCSSVGEVIGIGGLIPGLEAAQAAKETIRVDQAWKALKAHPNAKFASLAFLADVVAQRAPVSNSRSSTPNGGASPARPTARRAATIPGPRQATASASASISQPSLSAGISTLGIASPGASPAPSGTTGGTGSSRAGKRKVVETSALRDALHLLDAVEAGANAEQEMQARAGQMDGRGAKKAKIA